MSGTGDREGGRAAASLPASYFEDLYRRDPDPWRFATSDYERDKYAATLAALPRARYGRVLEVGCSIGVLTGALAPRCDALLSLDVVEEALEQARARLAERSHVRFERRRVPEEWPEAEAPFDLVLLSEVIYYLDRDDVGRLARVLSGSLAEGADIVAVHWTGETNYPLSGDEAAELFIRSSRDFARPTRAERTDAYRLDVLRAGG